MVVRPSESAVVRTVLVLPRRWVGTVRSPRGGGGSRTIDGGGGSRRRGRRGGREVHEGGIEPFGGGTWGCTGGVVVVGVGRDGSGAVRSVLRTEVVSFVSGTRSSFVDVVSARAFSFSIESRRVHHIFYVFVVF